MQESMLKQLMGIKGIILLISIVALILSIIAMTKGCNSNFGDINLDGTHGLAKEGDPC